VGIFRRLSRRLLETDEERLASSVTDWACTVPEAIRIDEAPTRSRVRVAGVVNRISVVPGQTGDSLEAVITDGTGEIVAMWTGRRAIPGMFLGTRMVVDGVLVQGSGVRKMVNPVFEFA